MNQRLTGPGWGRKSPGRSPVVPVLDTPSHGTAHSPHTLRHSHTSTVTTVSSHTLTTQQELDSYSQMYSSGVCSVIMSSCGDTWLIIVWWWQCTVIATALLITVLNSTPQSAFVLCDVILFKEFDLSCKNKNVTHFPRQTWSDMLNVQDFLAQWQADCRSSEFEANQRIMYINACKSSREIRSRSWVAPKV